jgi:hypothetical protein
MFDFYFSGGMTNFERFKEEGTPLNNSPQSLLPIISCLVSPECVVFSLSERFKVR